jgi:hypothetical protein
MKKILFIATILVSMLIPTQSYSAKFEGFFYNICKVDDYCHTLHMEFGVDSLKSTDVINISIFSEGKLKETFTKFNSNGVVHQGWFNFFTIKNMTPGADYTLEVKINGEKVWTESLRMPGPVPEPKKEQVPNDFKVYPNPSNGDFTIEIPFEEATITISDKEGRIVYSNSQNSFTQKIDPYLYLADGLYFVTLKKGDQIIGTKRLIINH